MLAGHIGLALDTGALDGGPLLGTPRPARGRRVRRARRRLAPRRPLLRAPPPALSPTLQPHAMGAATVGIRPATAGIRPATPRTHAQVRPLPRLRATIEDAAGARTLLAINEVFVGEVDPVRPCALEVALDDGPVQERRASGLRTYFLLTQLLHTLTHLLPDSLTNVQERRASGLRTYLPRTTHSLTHKLLT